MVLREGPKYCTQSVTSKTSTQIRTSYVTGADTACMSCDMENTLCKCAVNLNLRHRSSTWIWWKKHQLCFSCLHSDHFILQCTSDQKCQNVTSHTIRCCTRSLNTFVDNWSGCEAINASLMEESFISHSFHLSCPNSGGQHEVHEDLSDLHGDVRWLCNESISFAQLRIVHIICHGTFGMATTIDQLHVSIGILMKFLINVTSRLGSLVARRNVLKYMGKSWCHRLNYAPLHKYTVCAV